MPSMGKILIDGQPVTGPPEGVAGMAFQAPLAAALAHHGGQRAAAASKSSSPTAATSSKSAREYEERARKPLQKVGLAGYEDKFWQLSGGMRSSAPASAARLIHEPRMLLLDEPFGSALGPVSGC